jgi:polysaccharide deacetylase family protein (PEP-CTERM system associated)
MRHHLTVDVEEYFQVHALEPHVPRDSWPSLPSRVERGTYALMELMAEHGVQGTFFVLGWVAARHPRLVGDIAAAGHEVASHGWGHRKVTEITPEQFRASVRDSKRVLEDAAGWPVAGYRAPSCSLVAEREWAFDVLLEEGYRYDSSVFPGRRGDGWPADRRDPHRIARPAGVLDELPPATLEVGGRVLPAAGGAYLRLLPYGVVSGAVRQAERRGVPATLYVHPWEVDPSQPRIPVPLRTRVRHYCGLNRTLPRLARLMAEFRFQPIARTLALREEPWPLAA